MFTKEELRKMLNAAQDETHRMVDLGKDQSRPDEYSEYCELLKKLEGLHDT